MKQFSIRTAITFLVFCLLICSNAFAQLKGSYTIGGISADFPSFSSAADTLHKNGISGPVIFNVRDGIYNERINLNSVKGASSANTITFQSQSNDSSKVIVQLAADSSTLPLVQFNKSHWVIIKGITMSRSGAKLYSTVVNLYNSNHVVIEDCRIIGRAQYLYDDINQSVIMDSTSWDSDVVILNNVIKCGTFGIYASNSEYHSQYLNNTIDSFQFEGIYIYHHYNTVVSRNIISSPYFAEGIHEWYCKSGGFSITGNRILLENGGVGIYLRESDQKYALIANNFIYVHGDGSMGIYTYNDYGLYFYYNTVVCEGKNFNSISGYFDFETSCIIENNIFANFGLGFACSIYRIKSKVLPTLDYNDYYCTDSSLIRCDTKAYSSLGAWKTFSSQEQHSKSVNPYYASKTDPHVSNPILNNSATSTTNVSSDFYGTTRSKSKPDIGAVEFTPLLVDAGIIKIDSPGPYICSGAQNIRVSLFNFGSNTLTDVIIHWSLNGRKQSSFHWKGSLNQGVKDSGILLGNYHFYADSFYAIKSWTDSPNLVIDSFAYNDSSSGNNLILHGNNKSICSGAGTYLTCYPNNGDSIIWFTKSGGIFSNSKQPFVNPYVNTSYFIKIIQKSTGCQKNDSQFIAVLPKPKVTISGDSIVCARSNASYLATLNPGAQYSWGTSYGGKIIGNFNSNLLTVKWDSSMIFGSVQIIETYSTGCADTAKISIGIINGFPPKVNFGPWAGCLRDSIQFSDSSFKGSAGINSYSWNFGDGSAMSTLKNPMHLYSGGSIYNVSLKVTDSNGCSDTRVKSMFIDSTCVWPGDADYDKVVDAHDVLTIGLGYSFTGNARPNATTGWYSQPCQDWKNAFLSPLNYKQADCNGNNTIDYNDTLAVTANYSKTHLKALIRTQGKPTDAPFSVVFLKDSLQSGDTITADVVLGSSSIAAKNIYGLSFGIDFNSSLIDPSFIHIDFNPCWFAQKSLKNQLHFQKDLSGLGEIAMTVTRINHTDTSGDGRICRIRMLVGKSIPAIGAGFKFLIINNKLIDSKGNEIPVFMSDDSLQLRQTFTGVSSFGASIQNINIFPNPFQDYTKVEYTLQESYHVKAEVFDLTGRLMITLANEIQSPGQHTLKVDGIEAGTYILRLQIGEDVAHRKIVSLK